MHLENVLVSHASDSLPSSASSCLHNTLHSFMPCQFSGSSSKLPLAKSVKSYKQELLGFFVMFMWCPTKTEMSCVLGGCGLTPVGSWTICSFYHSPPWWGRGENWKGRNEKLMGWDQNTLKAEAGHTSKTRNSFTDSHREADVQPPPGKLDSITHDSYLGRQMLSFQMSTSSFSFPQLYMLSITSYGLE